MPRISLTAEPTLVETVEEALDALKIASSRAIVEWIKVHQPRVFEREASAALEQVICDLRNTRSIGNRGAA